MTGPLSTLNHLECPKCGASHDAARPAFLCLCGSPLLARYRLEEAARSLTPQALAARVPSMWRYREVLPGAGPPVTLGEGMTPLLHAARLGAMLGIASLYIKDESANPTGSFKARGMSAGVTVARDLGANRLAVPSAGNAGGALAAYGARGGMQVRVYLPERTPAPFFLEASVYGAEIRRVKGTIADCAKALGADNKDGAWYDMSTLREPYRIEGKKTMGYELFEQSGGRLPDAIIYPTGGGTGLIGMWKSFEEMQTLGWIGPERPRMVSVQAEGCAPIVRAFESGAGAADPFPNPRTYASGLLVPAARGDFLILRALRDSRGAALAVPDAEMAAAVHDLGRLEGVHAAPEGGATLAALRRLVSAGQVGSRETVVLFNTGSGLKYPDPPSRS